MHNLPKTFFLFGIFYFVVAERWSRERWSEAGDEFITACKIPLDSFPQFLLDGGKIEYDCVACDDFAVLILRGYRDERPRCPPRP